MSRRVGRVTLDLAIQTLRANRCRSGLRCSSGSCRCVFLGCSVRVLACGGGMCGRGVIRWVRDAELSGILILAGSIYDDLNTVMGYIWFQRCRRRPNECASVWY